MDGGTVHRVCPTDVPLFFRSICFSNSSCSSVSPPRVIWKRSRTRVVAGWAARPTFTNVVIRRKRSERLFRCESTWQGSQIWKLQARHSWKMVPLGCLAPQPWQMNPSWEARPRARPSFAGQHHGSDWSGCFFGKSSFAVVLHGENNVSVPANNRDAFYPALGSSKKIAWFRFCTALALSSK